MHSICEARLLSIATYSILLVYFATDSQAQRIQNPISREEAKELLLTRIVPPAHHEGPVSVFLLKEPVQSGDVIKPFISTKEQYLRVNATSWFAWIDDHPTAYFAHNTRVVLINIETGQWTTSNFLWWPELNGQNVFMNDEARNNEEVLIYSDLIILK